MTSQEESAEIEILTLRHLKELTDIVEGVYKNASTPIGGKWNRDSIKQELEIGQGLGLRVDGFGLAAFVLFRLYDHAREITLLATHTERHRRGDMKFLLSYLMERRTPGERVWLEVHAQNEAAQGLYNELGFQQVGRRPKYYRDGGDAVLFTMG